MITMCSKGHPSGAETIVHDSFQNPSDNGALSEVKISLEDKGRVSPEDVIFLGQRTPRHSRTPTNSPIDSNSPGDSGEVPLASLISISDDSTITTDSCAGVTHPETSVTWAGIGGVAGGVAPCTPTSTYLTGSCLEKESDLECFSPFDFGSTLAPFAPGGETCKRPLDPDLSSGSSAIPRGITYANEAIRRSTPSEGARVREASVQTINTTLQTYKAEPHLDHQDKIWADTKSKYPDTNNKEEAKSVNNSKENTSTKKKMCQENNYGPGPSDQREFCTEACTEKFNKLSKDLGETKDKLFSLALQMEEQASHISKLMEENRRYIQENGHLRKGRSRGANVSDSTPYDSYDNGVYRHHNHASAELEDKIVALRLQNSELGLCLEREKRRRMEAESRLEREEGYIKRLEDSVQTLRGTRVIMDPGTYRQVAEAYMAAKRTPARRHHTHSGVPGSDLVCDNPHSNIKSSHHMLHQTSSCPLSPNPFTSPSQRMYPSAESAEYPLYPKDISRGKSKDCGKQDRHSPMNPWDYQQLLESLEDLNGSSKGALS